MQGFKKIIVALPVMLVLMFLLTGMANAEAARTGTIKGDSVNVRAKPDTTSKVIIQLSDSTKVSVLSQEGDWYKITYNDATGWVFSDFIKAADAALTTGTVNGDNVNVRSKPDTSSEVLQRLDKGARVVIYEKTSEWYRIQIADDRYGWVSHDFITEKETSVSRGAGNDVRPAVNPGEAAVDTAGKTDGEAVGEADKDTGVREQILDYAKKFLGVKYVYGASSPKGFDCSGFVQYVFKHFGIELVRTSDGMGEHGTKIKRSELLPGDLVFFDTNGGLNHIEHVGIYVGDGKFIHASSYNHKVIISAMDTGTYNREFMCARRYVSDTEAKD